MRRASTDLIQDVIGEDKFFTTDHLLALREGKRDSKIIRDDSNDYKLKGLVEGLEASECCLILLAKNIGSLMGIRGTKVNGTVLAAMEFGDFCVHVMILPHLILKRILWLI